MNSKLKSMACVIMSFWEIDIENFTAVINHVQKENSISSHMKKEGSETQKQNVIKTYCFICALIAQKFVCK